MTATDRDLLNRFVVALDRFQRRRLDIWEFSDDPDCMFRLSLVQAREGARLKDGTVVQPGETVGIVHFWNERVPPIPASGPDLAWARELMRMATHSQRLLAQYVQTDPAMAGVQAFGGKLPFLYTAGAIRVLQRLGWEIFEPVPPRGLVERVTDLIARSWNLLMRRAFNPQSARGLQLSDFERRPAWLSRRTLIALYGSRGSGLDRASSTTSRVEKE